MENCRDSVKNVGQSSEFATGEYNVFSLNDFVSLQVFGITLRTCFIWFGTTLGFRNFFVYLEEKTKQQTNREQQAALLNSPEDGDRMRLFDDRKEYTISGEHCF